MKRLLVALWWLLTLGWTPGALAADPPKCLRLYSEDLAVLGPPERREVLRAVKAYDRAAQDGVEFFLQYREVPDDGMQRLHQALQNFRYQNTVPNPFQSDRDLMAALARVDQSNPGVQNYGRVLGDLGQDNALGFAQASAYDIFVADGLGPGNVSTFRQQVSLNGVSVEFDVIEGPPGANPLTVGLHENKSFVVPFDVNDLAFPVMDANGRFVYSDTRITGLAQEFDRHVVIHQPTGFANWHLNMRPQLAFERAQIQQMLLKQFESSIVTTRFDPLTIAQLKNLFLQRLPQNLQFR